jgi:hypothetical protein
MPFCAAAGDCVWMPFGHEYIAERKMGGCLVSGMVG